MGEGLVRTRRDILKLFYLCHVYFLPSTCHFFLPPAMLTSGASVLHIKGSLPKAKLGKNGTALLQSRELVFGFYQKTDEILGGQPVYKRNVTHTCGNVMLWYDNAGGKWLVSWEVDYGKPSSGAVWMYIEQNYQWYMITAPPGVASSLSKDYILAPQVSVDAYFDQDKDFDVTGLKGELNQTAAQRFVKAKSTEEQAYYNGTLSKSTYDSAVATKRKAEQVATSALVKDLDDAYAELKKARVAFSKAKKGSVCDDAAS